MTSRQQFIRMLQAAYSGERAAAYAYRGHWKSVRDASARERIRQIEHDEWDHREEVGAMLRGLDSEPAPLREIEMLVIGRMIGVLCFLTGWFLPMYFAGRLEGSNVVEYESAAGCAAALGLREYEAELRVMAAREKEHEVFFFSVIANHRLLPLMRSVFNWGDAALVNSKLR